MTEPLTKQRKPWVCFEGPDGSGKSTLANAFAKEVGESFVLKSPSAYAVGQLASNSLSSNLVVDIDPQARQLTFLSDIINTYIKEVIPTLVRGEMVVCDRWIMSTIVYQCAYLMAEGVEDIGIESSKSLFDYYKSITVGMGPDVTIYVDAPLPIRLKRIKKRGNQDMNEQRAKRFHMDVEKSYRELRTLPDFYSEGMNIHLTVSGVQPTETVVGQLLREIKHLEPPPLVVNHGILRRLIEQDSNNEM